MTADPRATLATLVAALERHLEVATSRRDPDDPSVMAAAQDLATAFDDYDEALFQATEVATPLAIYDGPFDDGDDDDDDGQPDVEVPDPGVYSGLEDDDLDYGEDGTPAAVAQPDGDEEDDDDDEDEDDEEDDDDLDDEFEDEDDDEDDEGDEEDDDEDADVSGPLVAR